VVRDVASAGVRRDDQKRDAEAQTHLVDLGRIDVIVPATPIIPSNDDCGVRPIRAIANRIHLEEMLPNNKTVVTRRIRIVRLGTCWPTSAKKAPANV
jgi:hypothetical protein